MLVFIRLCIHWACFGFGRGALCNKHPPVHCLCSGALFGHAAAPRASESDNPAGGGGAGTHSESDAVKAAADPRC